MFILRDLSEAPPCPTPSLTPFSLRPSGTLDVPDLLKMFEQTRHEQLDDDALLLG